jgi:hypothetical protein
MAAKQGAGVLFGMPNRDHFSRSAFQTGTNRVLSVSVMREAPKHFQ